MTFYVDFYADQAFLSFVKKHIEKEGDFNLEDGAVCIMSCAAALEAIINQFFISYTSLRHYDSLRFFEKIETLGDLSDVKVDKGNEPWQGIDNLIKIRNWLAHYKDTTIGLINSDSEWIVDEANKKPKIEPGMALSKHNIEKCYKSVLVAASILAEKLNTGIEYDYLKTQDYEPIIVG